MKRRRYKLSKHDWRWKENGTSKIPTGEVFKTYPTGGDLRRTEKKKTKSRGTHAKEGRQFHSL